MHRLGFGLAVLGLLSIGLTAPAQATVLPSSTSVTTKSGLTLTASQARRLNPDGQRIRVTGRGFNPAVGIYVALCKTPVRGQRPSPCGGGVNLDGSTAASAWVSSNPPPYGAALAVPYRAGGRFAVRITVSPMIGDIDCRTTSCSIVTRADHLRLTDRRYDVAIPVTFR